MSLTNPRAPLQSPRSRAAFGWRGERPIALLLLMGLSLGGCAAPRTTPSTAPAPASRESPDAAGPRFTPADVAFMQGMIPHHHQALEMAALVEERTDSDAIRLLAERIEVSQTDEIAQMSRWLADRGQEVPVPGQSVDRGTHAQHGGDHAALMPGMLSPEEMTRLAAARDAAFDRLFLEFMIKHHQGALTMVGELLSTAGAGQEVDAFRIASEIDSDQRMEIRRMEQMLATLR